MNRFIRTLVVAVALPALIVPATGSAQDSNRQLQTDLSGFNVVHAPSLSPAGVFNAGNGSIFSTGNGQLKLRIRFDEGIADLLLGRDFLLDAETAARIERIDGVIAARLSVAEAPRLALVS